MSSFVALMRVQVLSLANSIAPHAQEAARSSRARRLALTALGAALLAALIMFYMALMAAGIADTGLAEVIPAIALVAGSLSGIAFTFFKANGTLFGARDHDLVMSLPIARGVVVTSRLMALFVYGIVVAALFMVPMYVVYFWFVGASVRTVLFAALTVVLAPLAPTAVAAFAAFAVTAISARFRHANLAYIAIALLAMLAFMFVVYAFSFQAGIDEQQAMASVGGLAVGLRDTVSSVYPPAAWAVAAVCGGSAAGFAGFALFSLAVPVACAGIMQRFYLQINDLLAARGGARRRTGPLLMRSRSPFAAIVVKEFRTVLGIPAYAFNCLFGYLLMLAIAVALAVIGMRDALQEVVASGMVDGVQIDAAQFAAISEQLFLLVPWVFAFCSIMCPSAVISISLEGRSAWILATAPIPSRTMIGAKLASNALPVGICLVLSASVLLGAQEVDALGALEIVAVGFGLFYIWASIGLAIDAARPNFAWATPNEVVKRSLPVMVAVLGGLASVFGFGAAAFALSGALGPLAGHALNLAVGGACIVLGHLVYLHTARRATLIAA